MDYYYRKSMGNGAVTSKFRLNFTSPFQQNSSNLRSNSAADDKQPPPVKVEGGVAATEDGRRASLGELAKHASEAAAATGPATEPAAREGEGEGESSTAAAVSTAEAPAPVDGGTATAGSEAPPPTTPTVGTDASNDASASTASASTASAPASASSPTAANSGPAGPDGQKGAVSAPSIHNGSTPSTTAGDATPAAASSAATAASSATAAPIEYPETHHTSNCHRCYKLKKKCSREKPSCSNCAKSKAQCEYINRSNKRRKKVTISENERLIGDVNNKSFTAASYTGNGGAHRNGDAVYFTHKDGGAGSSAFARRPDSDDHRVRETVAHNLVSISSLLANEQAGAGAGGAPPTAASVVQSPAQARAQRLASATAGPYSSPAGSSSSSSAAAAGGAFRSRRAAYGASSADRLDAQVLRNSVASGNVKEEYITMKPISDLELPTRFIHTFFHNYETRCPFIDQGSFMKTFRAIDFTKETIVNLDVYLVLSIGCLIHDKNNNSSFFKSLFSENNIESSVEILNFDSLEGLRLLFLLILFKLNQYKEENLEHCWQLIGILTRQMMKLGVYSASGSAAGGAAGAIRGYSSSSSSSSAASTTAAAAAEEDVARERLFWSVYNLDKIISILFNRPSQLPRDEFIGLELPVDGAYGEDSSIVGLINQEISYSKMQNRLLTLKLTRPQYLPFQERAQLLKQLSADIEKWRVSISRIIHSSHYTAPEEYISLVNLNYYYFLIELDQVSMSESFQFTLQFLSNSFTLLIDDDESSKDEQRDPRAAAATGREQSPKRAIGFALSTSFWYSKLFQVVKYSLHSLVDEILSRATADKSETNLKLVEFNSNLQLMINLFKYLTKQRRNDMYYLNNKVELFATQLSVLGMKMMGFMMDSSNNKDALVDEVRKIIGVLYYAGVPDE